MAVSLIFDAKRHSFFGTSDFSGKSVQASPNFFEVIRESREFVGGDSRELKSNLSPISNL